MSFTHKQLCELAVKWLKRPPSKKGPGCTVAVSEVRADWTGECPDAIGFRAGVCGETSIIVEVKVSRSDFLADKKKPHRINPDKGMGEYRYYMAPEGLLAPSDMPDRWGLLEVNSRGVVQVKRGHLLAQKADLDTWKNQRSIQLEWAMLIRLLNRVGNVEEVQNRLKEAANRNSSMVAANEKLQHQNKALLRENIRLKRVQAY